MKITLFDKENITLEFSALFLFVLVLVSNLAVIEFAEGYFGYFDVSLGSINFMPQPYDYMRIAMPVLVTSIMMTLIITLLMRASSSAGEYFANRTKPNKRFSQYAKRHKKFLDGLINIVDFVFVAFVAGVIIWASYSPTTGLAKDFGEANAKNMTRLSSISKPSDSFQEIIIYKGNGEIITKTYNVSKKEFLDGYRVATTNDYQVRYINR